MNIWLACVICLTLVTVFSLLLVMKSQKSAIEKIADQSEKSATRDHELILRMTALLGTKDPLAYQVVELTKSQDSNLEGVSMSDAAEAERYGQWMENLGIDGYGD